MAWLSFLSRSLPMLLLLDVCTAQARPVMESAQSRGTQGASLLSNTSPGQITVVDGLAYFQAQASDRLNVELWVSDGTPVGTRRVEGIRPDESPMVAFDGKLFLDAVDFDHGSELWLSDGTAEGTHIVADLSPGPASSSPYELTVLNGFLLFFARLADGKVGLFRMDSSATAPILIRPFLPVFLSPEFAVGPFGIAAASTVILFVASDGRHTELWKSDGTPEGTVKVKDVTPGRLFDPSFVVANQGRVFFDAASGLQDRQLWVSDGTSVGTFALFTSRGLVPLGPLDGNFFFWAFDSLANGIVLWKTDGTITGTSAIEAFASYTSLSVALHGKLFFAIGELDHGVELWRTDGTAGGTTLVRDIFPGSTSSTPLSLTLADQVILFSAIDALHGRELWETDGSENGTFMIADINPGALSSNPHDFTIVGDSVLFGADGGTNGVGLWSIPVSALGGEPRQRERLPRELPFRR